MDEQQRDLIPQVRSISTSVRDNMASSASNPNSLPDTPRTSSSLDILMRIVFSHQRLIAVTTLVTLLCSLLYSFLSTPLYKAEAKLRIGTYSPILPGADIEDLIRQQTREQDYLQTQIELLSSLVAADKALNDPEIRQAIEGRLNRRSILAQAVAAISTLLGTQSAPKAGINDETHYQNPLPLLEYYLGLINITPIRKTSLVKIAATTEDPVLSAKIANHHGEVYIDLMRKDRQQSSIDNLTFLNAQAEELANKVALAERNMAAYAEANVIVNVDKNENIVLRKMSELNDLLTRAIAKRISAETAYKEAKAGSGVESTSLDDDSIRDLRTRLKQAEAEYAMLSEKFTPSYPRMTQLKAQIEEMKRNLAEQRTQAIRALEAAYNADLETENQLKKQLEDQKQKAFDLSRREVQYNIMKREYESLKDLYQSVLRQVKESQMASESPGSNVALSEFAAPPAKHASPRGLLSILLSLVLGPLFGFILALIQEVLDDTIKTVEDAKEVLQAGNLGIVPNYTQQAVTGDPHHSSALEWKEGNTREPAANIQFPAGGPLAGDSLWTPAPAVQPVLPVRRRRRSTSAITVVTPTSITSEAFRTVRTAIMLSSAERPPKTILVTSPKKSEGKTTLIVNLSVTMAQASSKTILVECDIRRPSAGRYFGLDSLTPGLVDYLTSHKGLDKVIHPTAVEGLFVIPAGTKSPNPGELIASRKMNELLVQLANQFDTVLVDAPPVLPVADAVVLSRNVDGVVIVLRSRSTPRQVAKDAADRLQQVGAKIIGFVLNDVDLKAGYHSYRYRDSYQQYYEEEDSTRPPLAEILRKLARLRRK